MYHRRSLRERNSSTSIASGETEAYLQRLSARRLRQDVRSRAPLRILRIIFIPKCSIMYYMHETRTSAHRWRPMNPKGSCAVPVGQTRTSAHLSRLINPNLFLFSCNRPVDATAARAFMAPQRLLAIQMRAVPRAAAAAAAAAASEHRLAIKPMT